MTIGISISPESKVQTHSLREFILPILNAVKCKKGNPQLYTTHDMQLLYIKTNEKNQHRIQHLGLLSTKLQQEQGVVIVSCDRISESVLVKWYSMAAQSQAPFHKVRPRPFPTNARLRRHLANWWYSYSSFNLLGFLLKAGRILRVFHFFPFLL